MPTSTRSGTSTGPNLTAEDVWRAVTKASFAVISHVTPTGEPRSSGVVYTTVGPRMYVVVDSRSWKARHIAADGRIAVTVPVRRGGVLTLLFPIPPATISFAATATVRPAADPDSATVIDQLGALLPPTGRESMSIVAIEPRGRYVTYGIGVPLMRMRDPEQARARVPVG